MQNFGKDNFGENLAEIEYIYIIKLYIFNLFKFFYLVSNLLIFYVGIHYYIPYYILSATIIHNIRIIVNAIETINYINEKF